jgi:hypothetical protein
MRRLGFGMRPRRISITVPSRASRRKRRTVDAARGHM